MFNIFKRKNTNNEKPIILLPYDSYEFFKILIKALKQFIPNNLSNSINFEIMNYDSLIQYDGLFDSPCINNESITINTSSTELDKLAYSIIDYWENDDSAECLWESIYKSCTEMNLYTIKLSFSFTNFSKTFESSALNIHWKLN